VLIYLDESLLEDDECLLLRAGDRDLLPGLRLAGGDPALRRGGERRRGEGERRRPGGGERRLERDRRRGGERRRGDGDRRRPPPKPLRGGLLPLGGLLPPAHGPLPPLAGDLLPAERPTGDLRPSRPRPGWTRGTRTGAAVISWPSIWPPSMCFMAVWASSGVSYSM